jgi:hypothetical protein
MVLKGRKIARSGVNMIDWYVVYKTLSLALVSFIIGYLAAKITIENKIRGK